MNKMKRRLLISVKSCIAVVLYVLLNSCQAVKPYQRVYLNDRDMQFGVFTQEFMEQKVQAYREGASGAGKGKTNGGCGCK